MNSNWELTGIPYTSAKDLGGIARAIDVLRGAGLGERLETLGVKDAGDLTLQEPTGVRGDSGLLNEQPLTHLVAETRERVRGAHDRGRLPLLVGGDCPVLIGALAAIDNEGGGRGLVMIDGHEDAWPPSASETGEASDSEVAIALGRVEELPTPLRDLLPLVSETGIAYLGPRDSAEIATAGIESLRGLVAFFAGGGEIADVAESPERLMAVALEAIKVESFWLHIDLDVLSSKDFAAVDYPQPGGLRWETLDRLTATAARDRRCRGASVVIYNPDLDANLEAAAQVVDYVSRLARVC